MDVRVKIVIVLIILLILGLKLSTTPSVVSVVPDEATKQAIEKGEFQFSDNKVVLIEDKDCEGTQWIKQQECSLNGNPLDGTEGSCGMGKEIWILDPNHSDFKPATGNGKCEPQERDCSVECPKPCEGDTWKDGGSCIRKEYDTRGNVTEVVLDGTEGKCGEGITTLQLDTTAPDYKPAIGKGECPMTKGGYCNVPCPKPEPPKCNSYTGWVENTGLGCVKSETDKTPVSCGETGFKMFFNVATDAKNCPELVKWETCSGKPCPINCEGNWSSWSEPKSDEPCGVQPYIERMFNITTAAQYGGKACEYPDGDTQTRNSGTPLKCCEEKGDWTLTPNSCGEDGYATYTQTFKENKVGGCPASAKSKKEPCCYEKGDWTDTTTCNSVGRKSQKQTTVGNCLDSVKTRQVDCKYISPWVESGGCSYQGKQTYLRTVVNGTESTQKTEDCCYKTDWVNSGTCKSDGKQTQTRTVKNCPGESATREVNCCYKTNWVNSGTCKSDGKQTQTRTVKNCPGESATREVNCCYKTNWTNSGGCSTSGKQSQTRTVKNCPGESVTREVNCCYKTNWTNSGGCSTSGKQSQTRTVKNCPGESATRNIDCCYTGNWSNSGSCKSNGKQTQTRPVAGCSAAPSREVDCCYISDWSNKGGCSTSGQQAQTRTVRNCGARPPATTQTVKCEYVGPWKLQPRYVTFRGRKFRVPSCTSEGKETWARVTKNSSQPATETRNCCYKTNWRNSGGCKSNAKQTQTRTVKNCPGESATREVDCSVDCKGDWKDKTSVTSSCNAIFCGRGGGRKNYKRTATKTYKEYEITQQAIGNGKACPHRAGEIKDENTTYDPSLNATGVQLCLGRVRTHPC